MDFLLDLTKFSQIPDLTKFRWLFLTVQVYTVIHSSELTGMGVGMLCPSVRAVPFYMLWWGQVTRSNFVRGDRVVLVKFFENIYGGEGGYRPILNMI